MNHFKTISLSTASLLLFSACSSKSFTLQSYVDENFNDKNTTQKEPNIAIKQGVGAQILPSSTYQAYEKNGGQGQMQKSLDEWTKEEWEPAFEGDKEQAQKDQEANEHFNLQHYYDKSYKYLNKKEEERIRAGIEKEPAHYETINSLPAIGK